MKIAISAQGTTFDAPIEERFGRTKLFFIYDLTTGKHYTIDNKQVLNAPQGAGIQAAQNLINAGVEAVITGHLGPKAFRVLEAADIKPYLVQNQIVQDAIHSFKEGKLQPTKNSDVESHWI